MHPLCQHVPHGLCSRGLAAATQRSTANPKGWHRAGARTNPCSDGTKSSGGTRADSASDGPTHCEILSGSGSGSAGLSGIRGSSACAGAAVVGARVRLQGTRAHRRASCERYRPEARPPARRRQGTAGGRRAPASPARTCAPYRACIHKLGSWPAAAGHSRARSHAPWLPGPSKSLPTGSRRAQCQACMHAGRQAASCRAEPLTSPRSTGAGR
jgi:hypothetical protein